MRRLSGRMTTSRLNHLVRSAATPADATAWHELHEPMQLKDELYRLQVLHGLSNHEVIERCGMERSYYYHILSGQKTPSTNMLLRLALCIGCNVEETNRLLKLARMTPLYSKVRRDALLIWALENHYTMAQTNKLLIAEGEAPLYREKKKVD